MTFAFTWNSAFLSLPADTENESLGAGRIRDLKNALTERFQVSFSYVGDANDGKLTTAYFISQTTQPVIGPVLYTYLSPSTGFNELYYTDNSGNVAQITAAGKLTNSVLPSGTTMSFLQSVVPVGWVQSSSFNDCMIRLTNGSGGGFGGGWAISGLNDAGVALSIAQMPNHQHTLPGYTVQNFGPYASTGSFSLGNGNAGNFTQGTGGSQAHYHTITGDGSWRPAYVNACVGVKS